MILLEFTEQIAEIRMRNGGDFLIENPLSSDARAQPPILRLEQSEDTYMAVSHMCRFGLKELGTQRLLKKPTWRLTSSPEIAAQLNRLCKCDLQRHPHGECLSSRKTQAAGRYTPAVARAILKGLSETLARKEPSRLTLSLIHI